MRLEQRKREKEAERDKEIINVHCSFDICEIQYPFICPSILTTIKTKKKKKGKRK